MVKKLRYRNDPVLHTVAAEIPKGEPVDLLIDVMWQTMYQHRGVGLAAPQIGESVRAIVVDANGFKQEFINPVIIKSYGGKATSREGCLSFPGEVVPKVRYRQIIVEGFTKEWQPIRRKLKGLAAYCVQHEVDHLEGVTIV